MRFAKIEKFFVALLSIVVLLLVANLIFFIRMVQFQGRLFEALEPFEQPSGLRQGTKVPFFNLQDTDGHIVSSDSFIGFPFLLIFSSIDCPACENVYPSIRQFEVEYPELIILLISRGSQEENRHLLQDQGFSFPVLDWEDDVAVDYLVPATPYFYLIDEHGAVAKVGSTISKEDIDVFVNAAP